MGQFDIDKYFKKRISSYAEDVDTNALWKELDLEEGKRERGAIFWFMGTLSILALVSVVYFGLFDQEQTLTDTTNNDRGSNETTVAMTTHETADPKIEQSLASNSNNETSHIYQSTNQKENAAERTITTSISQPSRSSEAIDQESSISLSQAVNSSNTWKVSKPIAQRPSTDNYSALSLGNSKEGTEEARIFPAIVSIDMLPIRRLAVDGFTTPPLATRNEILINKPLLREQVAFMELDVYTSYNMAQRRLSSRFLDDFTALVDSKNESETALDAIALGASLKLNLASGFYTKIGVEAMSITERFEHSIRGVENVVREDLVMGTVPVTSQWINYNHHRLVSLPLSMGYDRNMGRWSYFIEGGFHLNLFYQFSGLQLDLEGNLTEELSSPDIQVDDNSLRHSYVISGGVSYQLTPKISLYLQPRYQSTFSFNSGSSEGPVLSQNYNLYGVQLGLNYPLY